ncbi:MAG: bifunctional glutamine synthetase adenylyltransferase/deadenyltransferase [Alphaproteobacteria bacterium]|nr:bifunctional glutamine synthetase adenylyltransferase/deadenyltransferase [Alphaproteobacteria bacterium]
MSHDFFGGLPAIAALKIDLQRMLESARDYQDILDMTRRWARERRFHAGIHILKSLSPPRRCAQYLSDIAETALTCLLPFVEKEFAGAHGVFKSGEFILLAMGSFAAQEMYADSDLDIIALYKTSEKEKTSSGTKPLTPNVYYIRLMQRLISALSAPTAEGILYEVDARLRPAGNDGPLAAQLDGFFDYHKKDAWVWEHMSLIRSRLVYATPATAKYFTEEITKILSVKRDEKELRDEMLDMRGKVEKQFGSKDAWQLKYRRGGLMDVMFAVQFLILQNAHKYKGLFVPSLDDAISVLKKKKLLTAADAEKLSAAHHDAQAAQSFLRLCAELPFDPVKDPPGLKNALAEGVGGRKMTFKTLAARLEKNCKNAFQVYKKLLQG